MGKEIICPSCENALPEDFNMRKNSRCPYCGYKFPEDSITEPDPGPSPDSEPSPGPGPSPDPGNSRPDDPDSRNNKRLAVILGTAILILLILWIVIGRV